MRSHLSLSFTHSDWKSESAFISSSNDVAFNADGTNSRMDSMAFSAPSCVRKAVSLFAFTLRTLSSTVSTVFSASGLGVVVSVLETTTFGVGLLSGVRSHGATSPRFNSRRFALSVRDPVGRNTLPTSLPSLSLTKAKSPICSAVYPSASFSLSPKSFPAVTFGAVLPLFAASRFAFSSASFFALASAAALISASMAALSASSSRTAFSQ